MTLFVSTLAFFLFLLLGKVLLFINEAFYILVLLYVLYLFLLKFFIKKEIVLRFKYMIISMLVSLFCFVFSFCIIDRKFFHLSV